MYNRNFLAQLYSCLTIYTIQYLRSDGRLFQILVVRVAIVHLIFFDI